MKQMKKQKKSVNCRKKFMTMRRRKIVEKLRIQVIREANQKHEEEYRLYLERENFENR